MGWDGPIITDSGGFQVFSMGHGTVADEIKGRGRARRPTATSGAILAIDEDGVRFRSYLDGAVRLLTPEGSLAVQAALGSDIALAFDECTPFHVDRDYTARSTERTHRWLERCLRWHGEHAPARPAVLRDRAGRRPRGPAASSRPRPSRPAAATASRSAARWARTRRRCTRSSAGHAELERVAPERPRHLLGIGEVDDLIRGVELGIDTFDCAMPTRLARHGDRARARPAARWRVELDRARWREATSR